MKRVRIFVIGLLFFILNLIGQFTATQSGTFVHAEQNVQHQEVAFTILPQEYCPQQP